VESVDKLNFKRIIQKLKKHYGPPPAPYTIDPFELVVLENVAYLVDDSKRAKIFEELNQKIGLRPIDILTASIGDLEAVTKLSGAGSQQRAARLKESALIALNEFGGDVLGELKPPIAKTIKALKQFPGIGEPGAEKILLFTRTHPVLELDSNGLRVLLRLGFGSEKKNYSASYKSAREAIADQVSVDYDSLIEAHQLLRQHGKTLCKTNKPHCDQCPVSSSCAYYSSRT
jgi:endonuclease III